MAGIVVNVEHTRVDVAVDQASRIQPIKRQLEEGGDD